MTHRIVWNLDTDTNFTALRGMFDSPYSFQETVARLYAASGQEPASPDGYKVSVEFIGTFKGQVFTLYDYKGDDAIHIGGRGDLDVEGLQAALRAELAMATPEPFTATVVYDCDPPVKYGWPA